MASEAANEAGASGFLLGDDAAEFMRQRGEQTWESANEAGGCTAEWCDECEQCGNGGGLRVCCGYCNLVFHPTCLDPPQDAQVVENWDEVTFACGSCVKDAMGKVANTTQRLKRQMRQRRATTAAAEARRAARDNEIRDEHEAIALFVEQRAGGTKRQRDGGGDDGSDDRANKAARMREGLRRHRAAVSRRLCAHGRRALVPDACGPPPTVAAQPARAHREVRRDLLQESVP